RMSAPARRRWVKDSGIALACAALAVVVGESLSTRTRRSSVPMDRSFVRSTYHASAAATASAARGAVSCKRLLGGAAGRCDNRVSPRVPVLQPRSVETLFECFESVCDLEHPLLCRDRKRPENLNPLARGLAVFEVGAEWIRQREQETLARRFR